MFANAFEYVTYGAFTYTYIIIIYIYVHTDIHIHTMIHIYIYSIHIYDVCIYIYISKGQRKENSIVDPSVCLSSSLHRYFLLILSDHSFPFYSSVSPVVFVYSFSANPYIPVIPYPKLQ